MFNFVKLYFVVIVFILFLLSGCGVGIRQHDLDIWKNQPVQALDMQPFFSTLPVYNSFVKGVEIRNYKNSSYNYTCNNIFYIKDNTVLEYRPTGNCYTDETVHPFDISSLSMQKNEKLSKLTERQNSIENILKFTKYHPEDRTKWLFAIGIEHYDNADEVKFSKHSSETTIRVIQKTLGISDGNTYALLEEKATSGTIKDRLELFLRNVKKGDSIYFYYSGHGIPVLPDNEPYILPKDKIPEMIGRDEFFKLKNIYNMLSESKASKVFAFIDSCFSGSTDGRSTIKGIAATRMKPKDVTFDQEKMAVITAGQGTQYSNMYEEKGHRLFTYYLMKTLLKGKTQIKDIYADVYTNVKDESLKMGDLKKQEPQLNGNDKLEL